MKLPKQNKSVTNNDKQLKNELITLMKKQNTIISLILIHFKKTETMNKKEYFDIRKTLGKDTLDKRWSELLRSIHLK